MSWSNKIDITIDGSKINETLTNFPLLINLSESSGILNSDVSDIFTEIGDNYYKIKIEDEYGVQLFIEIENWDSIHKKAQLWVKVPTVKESEDTELSLYYSNDVADNTTYVGEVGEGAAQNVWDDDFVAVYHMNQSPDGGTNSILDSTSNTNHGTPHNMLSGDLVDGKIGKAILFDGSNDYIQLPYMSVFNQTAFMVMGWLWCDVSKNDEVLFSTGDTGGADKYLHCVVRNRNALIGFFSDDLQSSTTLPLNQWIHIAYVWEGPATRKRYIYINGEKDCEGTSGGNLSVTNGAATGNGGRIGTFGGRYHDGVTDELQILKIVKSGAWIKANYYSNNDNLITYTGETYILEIGNLNISSDLTNFPLLINLSSSAGINDYDLTKVFNTTGDNHKRIKITDSNDTILYTEVQEWDYDNKKALLWVKVPTVYSSTSTKLYLKYSNDNSDYISATPIAKPINLSVNINSEGTYDTHRSYMPFIIKESDTSYKMWYTGHDGSYGRIIYCTSTDGINWSNHQMVIDKGSEGTYDVRYAYAPYVIKENDTSYKMWYNGYDSSWVSRILYCTSTDGINWSNFQMVVDKGSEGTYDTQETAYSRIIKESDTSYKMWYAGHDGSHWRIIYCTSTDGINWSNFQMVVNYNSEGTYDNQSAQSPGIIKENDTSYKMWYSATDSSSYQRIIYCTSTNGVNWSNFQMVVDKGSEGTYDTQYAYAPCIIKESNNLYKMWYAGYDGTYHRTLYTTSEDGKVWTKNIVNRVWDDAYTAVYHMNQDPSGGANSIYDSTSNANHGTPNGNMTSDDLVDGQVGKAIDFDGINDYINIGNVFNPTYYTLEAIFKTSETGSNNSYTLVADTFDGLYVEASMYFNGTDNFNFITGFYNDPWYKDTSGITGKNDNTFHYAAATYDKSYLRSYIDTESHSTAITATISTHNRDYRIGARWDAESRGGWWNGVIDEVRISKIARSADWIKATYHSNLDNLVYYHSHSGVEAGWLETYENGELKKWAKRIKIDIDTTKIDDILIDFPVLVKLGESVGLTNKDVTDVLNMPNKTKIAITDIDGTSQLYTEIEYWSSTEKRAVLWTKVPRISSSENSSIYLYYDKYREDNTDYVGETGSQPAQNVWDDNFAGVWHMSQDPSGGTNSVLDSTSNQNHGTPQSNMNSNNLIDGKIGKALNFDGVDDYVKTLNHVDLSGSAITITAWFKGSVSQSIVRQQQWAGSKYVVSSWYGKHIISNDGGSSSGLSDGGLTDGNWHYVVLTWKQDSVNGFKTYKDGQLIVQRTSSNTPIPHIDDGIYFGSYQARQEFVNGIIDEVQISKTAKSASWIKANYYSNCDSLLTFNSVTKEPVFKYNGYVYVKNMPAARVVNLHRRSDGKLIGSTTSDANSGYFEIFAEDDTYHYSVILPELDEHYNLIASDKIKPES